MRRSKKTAQGLSGAHAYSRLPLRLPCAGGMLASQSSASNGIKNLLAGGAFLYRQRERGAAGGVVIAVPLAARIRGPPRTPSRVASVAGFHHERTKQTLARLRPGSTGGSARGYERSRVARPEHLNPWQAGRNYSITSSARASNGHGTVPCGNPICGNGMRFMNGLSLLMIPSAGLPEP